MWMEALRFGIGGLAIAVAFRAYKLLQKSLDKPGFSFLHLLGPLVFMFFALILTLLSITNETIKIVVDGQVLATLEKFYAPEAAAQNLSVLALEEGLTQIDTDLHVKMVEMKTFECCGGGKDDPGGGHHANLKVKDLDHVLTMLLNFASVSKDATVEEIKKMDQKKWKAFLARIDPVERRILLDTPFVMFQVEKNGKTIKEFSEKYYFKGEKLTINNSDDSTTNFEVYKVFDVKRFSKEHDSVVLRRL